MENPWMEAPDELLNALWSARRASGEIFNGCTIFDLRQRYGAENVKHENGTFWIRLPLRA